MDFPEPDGAEITMTLPGVRAVFEIPAFHLTHQFGETSGPGSRNYSCSGIAVVADSTWAALEARKRLKVEWNEPAGIRESTDSLRRKMTELVANPGSVIGNDGDFDRVHKSAAKRIEAIYEVPFLAHATMEPVNCSAHFRDGECELWAPTQIPDAAAASVAQALSTSKERVNVHVPFLGGGFGRRLIQDYAVEAALVSRIAKAPVKVIWTREDDIRHDFYRPPAVHSLRAGLDAKKAADVIATGAAQSWQLENRAPTMGEGKVEFGFAVDWMRKDLSICLAEARRNRSALPVAALVDQFYERVQERGGGRWDTSALIHLLMKP